MRRFALPLLVILTTAISGHTQSSTSTSTSGTTTVPTMPSASAAQTVLNQALDASGAANAQNPVQSFTATGTITIYEDGQPMQGTATVRAKNAAQFRLDANLPRGIWSIANTGASGTRKDETGKLTTIPAHNLLSSGGTTFPYLPIAAVVQNQNATITGAATSKYTLTDLGLVDSGTGTQLRQVRIVQNFPPQRDPTGLFTKLSQTDYYIDPKTNLVVKVIDMTHPVGTATREYPREVDYDNYATIAGISVPMHIRQQIDGRTVMDLNLSTITFNTALSDSDFQLQ